MLDRQIVLRGQLGKTEEWNGMKSGERGGRLVDGVYMGLQLYSVIYNRVQLPPTEQKMSGCK